MEISENGLTFISAFEKFESESYEDEANVWTIGYGTTELNGAPVTLGMFINEPVARALLKGKCNQISNSVNSSLYGLTQNQFDALVSFAYNIGMKNFVTSSLFKAIKFKLMITEDLFTRFDKIRKNGSLIDSPGLLKRRKTEFQLFSKKD